MAITEITARSLHQPRSSPAMARSASIASMKSFHLVSVSRSPYRSHEPPALHASMAAGASKDDHEGGGSRGSVSSRWRAVRESGSDAVMERISTMKRFFLPELPYAIITEVEKRMPLSFRDDEVQDGHRGLIVEKPQPQPEGQLNMMGPRCAWPRLKLASAEEERRVDAQAQSAILAGPRCAWPRGRVQAPDSLQECVEQEDMGYRVMNMAPSNEEVANGAKCAWPRSTTLSGTKTISPMTMSKSNMPQDIQKETSIPDPPLREGPRCAWPRSTTPRRMLATGVGLGLMNYLFIGQGFSALAVL